MKRLLPLLLLLITLTAGAQNYSCFQPDTIHYYINNDGYVRGIRIDSVHTVGGDILYYPYKTPRGYYEDQNWQPPYLDSTGGSWLGSKVIQQTDGITLFDNYWGDTVIINTHATIGDQWLFYQHFGSPYSYQAAVIAVDTMSFLGYTDSVKKIRIDAYDGNNINVADSMHGFEIILSKEHGFVRTFDMFLFPYHPHDSLYQNGRDYYLDKLLSGSMPGKNKCMFRIADHRFKGAHYQYDWNVNDVYQFSHCNYTCWQQYPMSGLSLDTIEQVNYSGDTAQYISSGWRMGVSYFPYNLNYTFHQSTLMQNFGILPQVYTPYMPEEKHQRYHWYFYPIDGFYCSSAPRYRFEHNFLLDEMYVHTFESGYFYADYKEGLGRVYYYIFHGGGVIEESERELIFYNRNGVTCGSYVPVGITDVHNKLMSAQVYPNPASGELTIDIPVSGYNITVLDMLGQVIYTKKGCSDKQLIDVSPFANGFYDIQLQLLGEPVLNKKILIHH